MTPDDIAKARAVISAATRGEWFRLLTSNTHGHLVDCSTSPDYIAAHCKKADADFIAAARNPGGWEDCLNEIERLQNKSCFECDDNLKNNKDGFLFAICQDCMDNFNCLEDKLRAAEQERDRLAEEIKEYEHIFYKSSASGPIVDKLRAAEQEIQRLQETKLGELLARLDAKEFSIDLLERERDRLAAEIIESTKLVTIVVDDNTKRVAREKVLVEALEKIQKYSWNPEIVSDTANETLAKLQAAEGGDFMSCKHDWLITSAKCLKCDDTKDINEDWLCGACSKPVGGRLLYCSDACASNIEELTALRAVAQEIEASSLYYADAPGVFEKLASWRKLYQERGRIIGKEA